MRVLLVLGLAGALYGAPILNEEILSGYISPLQVPNRGQLLFQTANLQLAGTFYLPFEDFLFRTGCSTCVPGQLYTTNLSLYGTLATAQAIPVGPGAASYLYNIAISGPAVPVNSTTITAPFTMQATVDLCTTVVNPYGPGPPCNPTTTLAFSGRGTQTLHFSLGQVTPTFPVYLFASSRYDFAPVPEPGTVFLALGAAVFFCGARLRRRAVSEPPHRAGGRLASLRVA